MSVRTFFVTADNVEDIECKINRVLKKNNIKDDEILDLKSSRQVHLAERTSGISKTKHQVMQEQWTALIIAKDSCPAYDRRMPVDTEGFYKEHVTRCICCNLPNTKKPLFYRSSNYRSEVDEDAERIVFHHKGLCVECYESHGYYTLLVKLLCYLASE